MKEGQFLHVVLVNDDSSGRARFELLANPIFDFWTVYIHQFAQLAHICSFYSGQVLNRCVGNKAFAADAINIDWNGNPPIFRVGNGDERELNIHLVCLGNKRVILA